MGFPQEILQVPSFEPCCSTSRGFLAHWLRNSDTFSNRGALNPKLVSEPGLGRPKSLLQHRPFGNSSILVPSSVSVLWGRCV